MSTNLDYSQVIQNVYDETENRLRVDADITAVIPGGIQVNINDTDDSIKVGDGSGNYLKINSDGSINAVLDTGPGATYTTINQYGEQDNVAQNASATMITYTTPATGKFYLSKVLYSSDGISSFEVDVNASTLGIQRLPYGTYNGTFDYSLSSVPGILVAASTVITISAINKSPSGPSTVNATLIGVIVS